LNQLDAINQFDPGGILTGRLDLAYVGIFGVSLGGEVSAEACRAEPRFQACLAIDVWMHPDVLRDGLQQPTMFISRDADSMRREGWLQAWTDETLGSMRSVYERLPGSGYWVLVPGMFHQNFSDAPLLSPIASRFGVTGPINGRLAHRIIGDYPPAFFDRHVKGEAAPLLDGPPVQYPEVLFETRQ
jgi:hypothetical protein